MMVIEVIGTCFVIGLSALTFRIIFGHWFCRYGLQALVVWASIGLSVGAIRLAVESGTIGGPAGRTWSGLVYAIGFLILLTVATGHFAWHHAMGERGHPKPDDGNPRRMV